MSNNPVDENFYEQTLIGLFKELGYDYECGYDVERDFREPYYVEDLQKALKALKKNNVPDPMCTGAYPKRNPKMWRLYAALNEDDDLVMIDHRDVESNGADGIPAENYKGKTYTIQHPGKYRYYALYIFDNWGDRYMQLGGFRFDQWEK